MKKSNVSLSRSFYLVFVGMGCCFSGGDDSDVQVSDTIALSTCHVTVIIVNFHNLRSNMVNLKFCEQCKSL